MTFRILLAAVFAVCFFRPQLSVPADTEFSEGENLFVERGCVRCHTVGGGRFVGPDLKGIFKRYDRQQIVLWMRAPSAVYEKEGKSPVNEGYPPMPQIAVSLEEAEKIADYLFSLRDISPPPSGGGIITGKVVNETTGKPAPDIEVTLGSFVADRLLSSSLEKTGAEGEFRFEGLRWTASHKISIIFGGVFYETDRMVFKPGQREIEISLPIYETETADGAISVELNHLIIELSPDGINVAEFVEFSNSGKTVVVSDAQSPEPSTLRFGVPENAANLIFIHGADAKEISENPPKFYDSPVLPGLKRVVFSYLIPFESGIFGGKASFTKTLEYASSSFVTVAPDTADIEVEGLGEKKKVSAADGKSFSRWDREFLQKGDKVKISARLSAAGKPIWILPATVFAVAILIAIFYRLKNKYQ